MKSKSEVDIFPHSKIEVIRNNQKLLQSLASFCDCTRQELLHALYSRCRESGKELIYFESLKEVLEKSTNRGYYKRRRIIKGKPRTIVTPNIAVKKTHDGINKRLDIIPVSLKSTASKLGDSPENHAEPHRYNRFLVTMDLLKAYPNVTAARVYENLQKTLTKPLGLRYPTLTASEKDLLLRSIVFLTVYEGELPQGVSTSDKIINIVLASTDRQIQKYLERQVAYVEPRYTRYKDDLAISYAANSTIFPLIKLLQNYSWKFEAIFSVRSDIYEFDEHVHQLIQKRMGGNAIQRTIDFGEDREVYKSLIDDLMSQVIKGKLEISEVVNSDLSKTILKYHRSRLMDDITTARDEFDKKVIGCLMQVKHLIDEIFSIKLELTNTQESDLYHAFINSIRDKLLSYRDRHIYKREGNEDYKDEIYKSIYAVIGVLDNHKKNYLIHATQANIDSLTETLVGIVSKEGWIINPKKTHQWTPSSSTPREITGIAFNERGERILPDYKREEYLRIYNLLLRAPLEEQKRLERRNYYKQFIVGNRVSIPRIQNTILGIRGRIKHVYGHRSPPRELKRYYVAVHELWRGESGRRPLITLEEDAGILPEMTEDERVIYEQKVSEIRFNEAPLTGEDYDMIPFPKEEDEVELENETDFY